MLPSCIARAPPGANPPLGMSEAPNPNGQYGPRIPAVAHPDAYIEPDRHEPMEGAGRGGFYGIDRGIQGRTVPLPQEPAARLGSIPIEDRPIAERLAQFNRRGRMAFWSARRHGASEVQALAAAERTLPR